MTWDAEDRQYVGVNDASGWIPEPLAFYNTRLWTISGGIQDAAFAEVSGYPDLSDFARPGERPPLLWPRSAGRARAPVPIPEHPRSGDAQTATLGRSEADLFG